MLSERKAQSTLEYVFIIIVGLLLVVAVVIIVRGNVIGTMSGAQNSSDIIRNATQNLTPT